MRKKEKSKKLKKLQSKRLEIKPNLKKPNLKKRLNEKKANLKKSNTKKKLNEKKSNQNKSRLAKSKQIEIKSNSKKSKKLKLNLVFVVAIILVVVFFSFMIGFKKIEVSGFLEDAFSLNSKNVLSNSLEDSQITDKDGNTKIYDSSDKEILIEDKDDNILIRLKLISDYTQNVREGQDIQVAEFLLVDWKEGVELFDSVNTYATKLDYKEANKNFVYKYGIDSVKDKVPITNWYEFTSLDELPSKDIKIGLFTDTVFGETIEWVPTIEGFEILEWATYDVTVGTPFEFDTDKGKENSIVQINETHYLNAYRGTDEHGYAVVLAVINKSNGTISKPGTAFEFYDGGNNYSDYTSLYKIDETHYLNLYTQVYGLVEPFHSAWATVLQVNLSDWSITAPTDAFGFDTEGVGFYSLEQIDSNHFLLTYESSNGDGYVRVLEVNLNNWTVTAPTERFEFDTSSGAYNSLEKINNTHYINAYSGKDGDGYVRVLEVNLDNWTVTSPAAVFEFDNYSAEFISMAKINNTHFIATYRGTSSYDGMANVFQVADDFTITSPRGAFNYGANYGTENSLHRINNSHFLNTYRKAGNEGYAMIFEVNQNNLTITNPASDVQFYSDASALGNSLEQIDGNHFINTFQGKDYDGFAVVLEVNMTVLPEEEEGDFDPIPVGTYTSSSGNDSLDGARFVFVSGDYAYTVCYMDDTLAVWNISAHGNPILVGNYTDSEGDYSLDYPISVFVSGDYAYTVSYNDHTLAVFDISAHGNPVPVGTYTDSGAYSLEYAESVFVSGDYAYTISGYDDTLAVFDISAHGNPVPVGKYVASDGNYSLDNARSVFVSGDYAYTVSYTDHTLAVFDISAHGNPVPVGNYADSDGDYSLDSATSVSVSGDYAYTVGSTDDTLAVFDISAHGNPVPVGTYADSKGDYSLDDARSVFVSEDYVYTVSYIDSTLAVWNISAHGNPVPIGSYTDLEGDYSLECARSVFVSRYYAYTVGSTDDTLAVFKIPITDITSPTYSDNSTNSTSAGGSTLFSLLADDDHVLTPNGTYIFSTNNTGIWANDSAVNFTAIPSWANAIHTLNSTEGISIGYRWHINDSSANINNTEIYTLTTTAADTCTCPSINTNWEVDMSDYCVLSTTCDLGTGNLTFTGTGNFTCNSVLNVNNMDQPGANQIMYVGASCEMEVG